MAITYLGGGIVEGIKGSSPKCATFDGSNDVVTGLGNLFSGTGAYSLSVWLYHTGGTTGNDGVCSADGAQEFLFYQGSSQKMYCTSPTGMYSSTTVAENTWFHVCITRDASSNVKFYLNGGTPTTATASGSIVSDSWRFGYAHTTEFWGGSACEFATWSGRELTAVEVGKIYNSGSPTKLPDAGLTSYTTNLTGYYPMDTDFDKFAGVGGNNGSVSGATVGNSTPVTPIPAPDEKATITNVPVGTRWHETDTRKVFRYANDLVDGDGLKCYIKFDDASGNHTNQAGSVTGNATLGSNADITPAGTGTIDYQTTGLPSKLGTGAEYPSTSATSGRYGVFGSSTSQFNFLHGGGTSTKFTVCFWAKYGTTAYNNQVIIRSGTGDTTAGIVIYHYGSSSGDGGIRCFISRQGGGNQQALQGYSSSNFFLFDDAWHFYTFQLDWQESTDKLIMTRDMGTSSPARQTFNQNSSYVPDAISQNSADPLCFRQDADQRGTYIPPTAEYSEMSIWSRCLTHAEITKIYNSGNGMQLDTGVDVWKEKGTA